jgi:hypothetical protein
MIPKKKQHSSAKLLELFTDSVFLVGIGWYFPGIDHEGDAEPL